MSKPRRVAGRYRIKRLLGRGGMGEVYLAHDERLERDVALKLLREGLDVPDAVERLRREARAAANLVHPNVVTVFDQGEEAGDFYIAMEYVEGQTLADVIAAGTPMALATTLQLLQALCAGLGHAHQRGIIHRDIKPANLMLTPDGVLRILDFGVARFGPSTLTGENVVVGSIRYMSPEQLALQNVDHRSDIFSVGAVFYELLAGRPAFDGGSIEEIFDQISNARFAPLEAICPDVPSRVVGIVRQALDQSAERRFQDLRDMSRAIDRARADISGQEDSRLAATRPVADRPQPPKPVTSRLPQAALPRPGFMAWLQRRVLTGPPTDYLWLAGLGTLPLALAWWAGALWDSTIPSPSGLAALCQGGGSPLRMIEGYGSRPNWWPYFFVLSLTLLIIRLVARRLFPLANGGGEGTPGLLLRIRGRDHQTALARLREVGMDPRNAAGALAIALAITAVDLREVASYYVTALQGQPLRACPRELDWTVQFLAGGGLTLWLNASLLAAAYSCQFVLSALAMMVMALPLRHNLFYLQTIYLRHRAARYPETQHIVLDFDDVERCFGLRVMHSTFNLQIAMLIVGGVMVTSSRLVNVNPTAVSARYQEVLAMLTSRTPPPSSAAAPLGIVALFPDAGQVIIAAAWISCFVIVGLPSLVKFLPLLYKRARIVGRKEYLIEFLPPGRTPKLDTQEEVDALAAKFSRSSFWPAGDNRARLLYLVAFAVLFFVLAPLPVAQGRYLVLHAAALLLLAALCTKATFWLMRKVLVAIDSSLAQ